MNKDNRIVVGEDDFKGSIEAEDLAASESSGYVHIQLDGGEVVAVPRSVLHEDDDGSYYVPLSSADLAKLDLGSDKEPPLIVPVVAERLKLRKRKTTTGRVVIKRHISEREEVVDEPGYRETVSVERVPVDDLLEEPAKVRFEGDTMIIPVMEEVVTIQRRWLLKEEVRVTKLREAAHDPQTVVLREEEVTIERKDLDTDETVEGS